MLQRAYGYVRYSPSDVEKNYPNAETQIESIESYAKKVGLKVSQVFSDRPIEKAGDIDTSLGGVYTLLDEARRKKVFFIIVYDLDRLKRDEVPDVHFLAELIRINKCVLTVGQEFDILKKYKMSDFVSDLFDNDMKRKKQSGPVPYGYRKEFLCGQKSYIVPNENEAKIIQMIFEEYKKRKSYAAVKRFLESKNIKTRGQNKWSRAGLAWILKNEIYLGVSKYDKEDSKESHQKIIDRELFDEVQLIIKQRQRKKKNATSEDNDCNEDNQDEP